MCGIAGIINWEHSPDRASLDKMCKKLTHRGPDDFGIISLANIALGHRRLSIIDLTSNAHQPMASKDGRYYIVYNGEVYNFKELREELKQEGIIFKSASDTEVVLYSYIRWGSKCLNKFNGMFSFAIWDDKRRELFLARDRFGKKPLYYYYDHNNFIFASELNALILNEIVPRDISYESLNCYLALGYILSPLTIYTNVYKLEPATYLFISNQGKSVIKTKYWDYAESFRRKTNAAERDIAANVLELLTNSIKRRMISDVPVGAFLSGGIDSSSIVAIMKKYHSGDLHTFSIGFEEKDYNELKDADKAAKWINTLHHGKVISLDESSGLIDEAISVYDEPFADNSLIPTVELSRIASSFVKVSLSGDGADEIFAGYITYKADRLHGYANIIPSPLKRLIYKLSLPGSINNKKIGFGYKQKQFFYGTLYNSEKAHYLWRNIFSPEERTRLLGEKFRDLVYDTDPFYIFKKFYNSVKDLHWLDRSLYVDAMTWLTDDILVKVDRASMNKSIEVRCPYLDVDLVSFVASIPSGLKMRGLKTKYILKKSLNSVLPDFILNKKKSGFNAPVGNWINFEGINEFKAFNKYVFHKRMKAYFS